ncbi:MAG: hypothetical protein OXH70_04785 [Acidobacteria bacterium]|nr:hypothetical protein [Acidobacteriota bacterium]
MPQAQLRKVFGMLDECAPGYTSVETDHHWVVRFADREPFRLPKGEHSRQAARTGGVHLGTIRSMCRRFAIMDCARRVLPQLK